MGQMETGLKIDLGQQSRRQYSLTSHKDFTQPNHPLKKKFAKSAFFHNFALFQVNKCPVYWANGDRGLKSISGNKAADSTL